MSSAERAARAAQPTPGVEAHREAWRRAYREPPTLAEVQVARVRGWRLRYEPSPRDPRRRPPGWYVHDRQDQAIAGPWPSNVDAWAWIRRELSSPEAPGGGARAR